MSVNQSNMLYNRPDIATWVGFLVMWSAQLEAFLPPMLANVLGIPLPVAVAILQKIDNISAKLSIIETAAQRSSGPKAAAALAIMPDLTASIALRNKLCHGLYGINHLLGIELLSNVASDRRGKIKHEHLDGTDLYKAVERLRLALFRIENDIGAPYLFDALKAQALASQEKRAQANPKKGKPPKGRSDPSGHSPP